MTLWLASACKHEQAKPTLAVSIAPQKWILEQLVGDKYDIVTLLTPDADPERYDPQVNTFKNLQHAKLYFRVGTIGFEMASLEKLAENFPQLKVVNSSQGIKLIEGTHPGPHGRDPHIWTSVKEVRVMAKNMHDELVKTDPNEKKYYDRRFAEFNKRLDNLDAKIRAKLKDHQGEPFVITHPSLSYFAKDYGLRQISLEVAGKEPSPRQLRARQDEAKQSGAKVFIIDRAHDNKQIRNTAKQLGMDVREVSILDYDWDDSMLQIADAIAGKQP